jgi:hypothetical protein
MAGQIDIGDADRIGRRAEQDGDSVVGAVGGCNVVPSVAVEVADGNPSRLLTPEM